MPIKCAVIDDEWSSREYLRTLLSELWPDLAISSLSDSIASAIQVLKQDPPDVVFLDVRMPGGTGFDILESIPDKPEMLIVLITGYSDYGIRAVKHGVFDYLLKPIDRNELSLCIDKLKKKLADLYPHIKIPSDDYLSQRIAIHGLNGFQIVFLKQIVHLKASGSYTDVHLDDGQKVIVTKSLGEFERRLDERWFFRIHRSHIINLFHFKEYVSADGGYALLKNGSRIFISRYRLGDFLNSVERLTQGLKV